MLGLIEAGNDGMLFSTAVVLNGGRVAGIYRKRHPNEDCFAAGTELPVFDVAGLRAAIGVCADARNHEDAALLAARQVDVVLYPLNNMLPTDVALRWRHRHKEILTERARQTGAWALSADVVGGRDDHISYGCTAAVDPVGNVHQHVTEGRTGIALVTVPARTGHQEPSSRLVPGRMQARES